jgi:hypothetical protein
VVDFEGRAVRILYRRNLADSAGNEAHAATFIRQRVIVLDRELKRNKREHERVLLHERFHFVWVRIGNPKRLEWEGLLRAEIESHARGEAGWSAEWRKRKLSARDIAQRSRRWREYCCESFCDSGAVYAGARSGENNLSRKWLELRLKWLGDRLGTHSLPI